MSVVLIAVASRIRPARIGLGMILAAGVVATVACGGDTTGPTPTTLSVTGLSPSTGASLGGTEVSLNGTGFASGATVTFGGVTAQSVQVTNSTTIKATAPAHAAGTVSVIVTSGGTSAVSPQGFVYYDLAPNPPPVIASIVVQGTRANEPAQFADLGETVNVVATVTDQETPASQLGFAWSASAGTITGTGASATWRAPDVALSIPLNVTIQLTVTESIPTGRSDVSVFHQRTTATSVVRVHDSVSEISKLAVQFLVDFSHSELAPSYVVRDFYTGCRGAAEELGDVELNRAALVITQYQVDPPTLARVNFGGRCPWQNRSGDGCVQVPCKWWSRFYATGETTVASGTDHLTAVYRDSRWWLCDSNWEGTQSPATTLRFWK